LTEFEGYAMTPLLDKALEEIRKLPEEEQEAFAALILNELEADKRWTELLAKSEDMLIDLADEALKEHRAGKTKALDLDDL
jgi:hypothetical protein